jgi:hypothetical protein
MVLVRSGLGNLGSAVVGSLRSPKIKSCQASIPDIRPAHFIEGVGCHRVESAAGINSQSVLLSQR